MMATWMSIAIGLVLLLIGGELLVRGAVASAKALGVSPLLIGLTLVGFGTSTPELVTSVTAAMNGSPGIAVGNVVGSNIANILLILGLAAVIYPMAVNPKGFKRDAIMLVASAIACTVVVLYGRMGPIIGMLFIASLLAYVGYVYMQEKTAPDEAALVAEHRSEDAPKGPKTMVLSLLMAVAGIAVTIYGARFLVDGAIDLAKSYGVSDTIIGLTIVAVGTSLPELAASMVAAIKRQGDVAVGNIIGSNIFNILGILGIAAMVKPISISPNFPAFDIPVMVLATVAMLVVLLAKWPLGRIVGTVFMAGYVAYTLALANGVTSF